jgi:hypothetical protein
MSGPCLEGGADIREHAARMDGRATGGNTMSKADGSRADAADRVRITLATSNGTGMGHLARQIAVALALASRQEPVIFSMSTALPIVREHGLRGEYCPSPHLGWMPHADWHGYLRDRLRAFLDETKSRVVVFDGVVPYLGLLRARAALPHVAFVWSRRGMWRPGTNVAALRAQPFFDLVLEPGDLAAKADRGATAGRDDAARVAPITLLEHVTLLPRADAAEVLGLDPDRPTALVTLGTRFPDDLSTPGNATLRVLLSDPEWQIAVTRAHIAREGLPLGDPNRVVELRGVYPLARYLSAFDAAVSAAGYNTFHELLLTGVPTLLVPSRAMGTDDQEARARWAADNGLALIASQDDPETIGAQTSQLLDPTVRGSLQAACAALPRETGATQAAGLIAALARAFAGHRASLRERLRSIELEARATATRALGTAGATWARRALGRPASAGPVRPLRVRLCDDESRPPAPVPGMTTQPAEAPLLVMTDRLEVLPAATPVEHLLAGASKGYRAQRRRIAQRYYDTINP